MPHDLLTTLLLCTAAAGAGAMDAIVGGGGLVQVPALLVALPTTATADLLGTNKLAAMCGTAVAAGRYAREHRPRARHAVPMAIGAFLGAAGGARLASQVPTRSMKIIVLVALAVVLVVTARRKDFGSLDRGHPSERRARVVALVGGTSIGFYDGLIGPGTGTFLLFLLIVAEGATFVRASATAKFVNLATNLAALTVFAAGGHVLFALGALMAASNMVGSAFGARLAIRHGSAFVRVVFLVVVTALLVRLLVDVL